jgi:hypothetical protein
MSFGVSPLKATRLIISALADTVLPLRTPIYGTDGTQIHELPLRKGQDVWVAISTLNRSKTIWGLDADQWVPDRFMRPLPESVAEASVPGVYSNQ